MPSISIPFSRELGPVVDIYIGVTKAREQALANAGLPTPSILPIRMLIDTGATSSCIDESVIRPLGLAPTGIVPVMTPTTGAHPAEMFQYDVRLFLGAPLYKFFDALPVTACHLIPHGIQGLLGRDVLANCVFFCNGEAGFFTLAI